MKQCPRWGQTPMQAIITNVENIEPVLTNALVPQTSEVITNVTSSPSNVKRKLIERNDVIIPINIANVVSTYKEKKASSIRRKISTSSVRRKTSTSKCNSRISVCFNCGTSKTPHWRNNREGKRLCNACGRFETRTGVNRPLSMGIPAPRKKDVIKSKFLNGFYLY